MHRRHLTPTHCSLGLPTTHTALGTALISIYTADQYQSTLKALVKTLYIVSQASQGYGQLQKQQPSSSTTAALVKIQNSETHQTYEVEIPQQSNPISKGGVCV